MKKKLIALLLVLVMVLSLFAACGSKAAEEPEEKEAPELAKGWYAVLNEDGETVAYLQSTGKKLTVYDEEGNETMEASKFSWDEDEEAFVIGDAAAFTLEAAKKETTFTVPKKSPLPIDKGTYTLDEIDEAEVPQPADTPDPVVDPEPTPIDPEPTPIDPEPAATETFYTLPAGCYLVQMDGKDFCYMKFDGTTLSLYLPDGTFVESYEMTYDETTGMYAMDDGSQLKVNVSTSGDYYLTEPDTPDLELWLYSVDESVIPVPVAGVLAGEVVEFITWDGISLYLTIPAGLTPLVYAGNQVWVEGDAWSTDYLNSYSSNDCGEYRIYSLACAKNEHGTYRFDSSIENDVWNMTGNELYDHIEGIFDPQVSDLSEGQLICYTSPAKYTIGDITFWYVYFDRLIDGEYFSDLEMVADIGKYVWYISLQHSGTTSKDDYNSWSDFDDEFVGSFEIR